MNYPFVKCHHPKVIENKYTKEFIFVKCGKCAACQLMKANISESMCDIEAKVHRYSFFVNLSYSPEFLPTAKVVMVHDQEIVGTKLTKKLTDYYRYYLFDITEPRKGIVKYTPISDDRYIGCYQLPAKDICGISYDKQLHIMNKFFGRCKHLPYMNIGILSKSDLQKFIKRVRKAISKKYPYEEIRYYAVGEYGPQSFRPHYHIDFFFDSHELAQDIEEVVRSCWSFGHIVSSFDKGRARSYITSYLNSASKVTNIHQIKSIRPFSLHSQHFGTDFLNYNREAIYNGEAKERLRNILSEIKGSDEDFPLWRSFVSYWYPKLPTSRNFDISELPYLYSIYKEATSFCGTSVVSQQVDILYNTIYNINQPYSIPYLWKKILEIQPDGTLNVTKSRLTSLLYQSKHFLCVCCDGTDMLAVTKRVNDIVNFHSELEIKSLNAFLQTQQVYFDNPNHNIVDLIQMYVNNFDYDVLHNNTLYRNYVINSTLLAEQAIKHKSQNDKNDIFIY